MSHNPNHERRPGVHCGTGGWDRMRDEYGVPEMSFKCARQGIFDAISAIFSDIYYNQAFIFRKNL
jgi:hypothetical protein